MQALFSIKKRKNVLHPYVRFGAFEILMSEMSELWLLGLLSVLWLLSVSGFCPFCTLCGERHYRSDRSSVGVCVYIIYALLTRRFRKGYINLQREQTTSPLPVNSLRARAMFRLYYNIPFVTNCKSYPQD